MTARADFLAEAVRAARRLDESLALSLADMAAFAPVTAAMVEHATRAKHKDTQAFLKTFEQLQDLVANRLIRAILVEEAIDTSGWSARDAFDKMEALGALQDAHEFRKIAQLRNRLVHEYPMSAERRAQRINDAIAAARRLRLDVVSLVGHADELLERDADRRADEGLRAAEQELDRIIAEIPDDIWVWGLDRSSPEVWMPRKPGEEPPELSETGFRNLYEADLARRIRRWQAWERLNPDIQPVSSLICGIHTGWIGDENRPEGLAAIVMGATSTGFLLTKWAAFSVEEPDIAWPVKMWAGTLGDAEAFRERLADDTDLPHLIEFWARGPAER